MAPAPFTLLHTIPCGNLLGEGIQWHPEEGAFWWVDIKAPTLHCFILTSQTHKVWPMPEAIGCFAFATQDERLLLALASRLAWFNPRTGECQTLCEVDPQWPGNRLNDGRVDRQGRFWVGSIVEQVHNPQQSAGLFSYTPQHGLQQHLRGLQISNSLCWNKAGNRLYHADSPCRSIHAYAFNTETGQLGQGQLFAQTPEGVDPDGACVDADDHVWSAQWGGSRVLRYTPEGQIERQLDMPVTQPTCPAFGGPQLNLLAVTSARIGLSPEALAQQPQAGHVFIYQTDCQGLPEMRFGKQG